VPALRFWQENLNQGKAALEVVGWDQSRGVTVWELTGEEGGDEEVGERNGD